MMNALGVGRGVNEFAIGAERHYGKYRGHVTDNKDADGLGRIKATVPDVLHDVETGWALPCAPYSGDKSGSFTVPAVGAGVWIEFEAGMVWCPIWSGCWWTRGKTPTDETGTAATPDLKVLRSEKGLMVAMHDDSKSIAVSDSDGKNLLHIEVQSGTVSVKATTKVVVDAPQIELVENAAHALVFGDSLLSYLNQVVQMFNSHMHPGETAAFGGPVTPMPPVPMLSPPTPSLLSTQVKTG